MSLCGSINTCYFYLTMGSKIAYIVQKCKPLIGEIHISREIIEIMKNYNKTTSLYLSVSKKGHYSDRKILHF